MKRYLTSRRLFLRKITEQDLVHLHQLDSDPEVMRYINGGEALSLATVRDEILPKILAWYDEYEHFGIYAAIHGITQGFMGWFLFKPFEEQPDEFELGYRLHRHNWGQGYATEGSLALLKKGFIDLELPKIVAVAFPANKASIAVMKNVGMTLEKRFQQTTGSDVVKYSITRDQFLATQSKGK